MISGLIVTKFRVKQYFSETYENKKKESQDLRRTEKKEGQDLRRTEKNEGE